MSLLGKKGKRVVVVVEGYTTLNKHEEETKNDEQYKKHSIILDNPQTKQICPLLSVAYSFASLFAPINM